MNRIDRANREALDRINRAEPELLGVEFAKDVIPQLDECTVAHAGPPIAWQEMCGPLKGAIVGAAVYEGMADGVAEAQALAEQGKIRFVSNHSIGCVGPMAGVITRSMPLWKVQNKTFGNIAYTCFNEGPGRQLRFGANSPDVIERLHWHQKVLAPALKAMLGQMEPVSLKVIIAKALTMGDELHQRNTASSALIFQTFVPELSKVVEDRRTLSEITRFMVNSPQYFLNLSMAAGKVTMDPVKNIEHCSVVTAMSRNGTNFGIKVSALGEQWFEAPAEIPTGLYFPGFSEKDANPDIGDSAILETFGIGGFCMGASPAVVRFVGTASAEEALTFSREMQEITVGQSNTYQIPGLDFAGTATGIDIRRVVENCITPVINTGMAHKEAGLGQVGGGTVRAPYECFAKALYALAAAEGVC